MVNRVRCSDGDTENQPLDGAALAGRVAAFEHHDVPVAVRLTPLLQLQQFDLQQPFLFLVLLALHALVVRVVLAPGVDRNALGIQEDRVVIVVVMDDVVV